MRDDSAKLTISQYITHLQKSTKTPETIIDLLSFSQKR